MILLQLLIILIVLRVFYKIYNNELLKKIENFKPFDDRSLPLVGDIFRGLFKSSNDIYQYIIDQSANISDTRVGSVFCFYFACVTNPKDVKTILSSPYAFEKATPFCVIGGGRYAILTAFANYWKPLRRNVNSIISIASLKSYFNNFNECARLLINDLDQYVDKGDFDINKPVGTAVTNSALRSHLNITEDDHASIYEHYKMVEIILTVNGNRMFQFYYQIIIMWFRNTFKVRALDWQLSQKLIDMWRPYIGKISETIDSSTMNEKDGEKTDFFMKRMIRLYKTGFLIKHSLYENLIYFIAAASNTGAITTSNSCLIMAFFPEIADKLYNEIVEYVGDKDEIDYQTIGKMEYLDRVSKEILRLYPAVPILARKITDDIPIENGILPKGFDIVIPIRNLHRDKNVWGPNADKFDPDNFLPDRVAHRPICSYIPFAYGLRNCLGYRYATHLNKVLLVHLVKNYKFSTRLKEDELKFGFALTSKLLGEHTVSITRRR